MTAITIIIPVRNDARRLANCLASIDRSRSSRVAATVVVADNGSTDDSPGVAVASGARVLALPGLRVSQLRNAAATAADGDVLAFVDADQELVAGWLLGAAEAIAGPSVGAVGALYVAPKPGTWVQTAYGAMRGQTVGRQEVAWLASGNLVVRRDAFQQVGGFDPSLEACEDVDLCKRLRAAGWTIMADERLASIHHGDPPTLAALFRAERWRGRNNIRVSLRRPVTTREIAGLTPALLVLPAIVVLVASGLARIARVGTPMWPTLVAGLILIGLPVLFTIRAAVRSQIRNPIELARLLVVVFVYNIARGLAIVTRARHHRR